MSRELIKKCIEYGITGNAKEFLENLEETYDKIAKAEKEDNDELTINMVEWINENVKNAGPIFKDFTDEQMFFLGIGVLSNYIADMLQNMNIEG